MRQVLILLALLVRQVLILLALLVQKYLLGTKFACFTSTTVLALRAPREADECPGVTVYEAFSY